MTNEEAIEIVKAFREAMDQPITNYRDVLLGALDMAVEALKDARPEGKWIEDRDSYKCSICGRRIETEVFEDPITHYPFCHCGARMVDREFREKECIDSSKEFSDVVNDFISEQLYGIPYSTLINEDIDE